MHQKLQHAALYVVLEKSHGVRYFLPDSEERTITEELNCVLKPFHRTTTAMSAALYPTLSILSPVLYKLLDIVFKVKEDTPSGKHETNATDWCRHYASLNQQQMLSFSYPQLQDLDLRLTGQMLRDQDLTGTKATRKHVSGHDVVKSEVDHYDQESLLDLDEDPQVLAVTVSSDVSGC